MVKNLPVTQKTQVQSLGQEHPLEKGMATHCSILDLAVAAVAVFLPGESHGQRSLAGCSPWGRKEPDMTERLTVLSMIYQMRHVK